MIYLTTKEWLIMEPTNQVELIKELVDSVVIIKKTDCPLKRIHKNGLKHMMAEQIKTIVKQYEQKVDDSEE